MRLINGIKLFWWAIKNPDTIKPAMFKLLSDLLVLILTVSKEDRHRMTSIAFIHPEDGKEHQIVSIWAGAGVDSSPTKRIQELLEENSRLKMLLSNEIEKNKK